MKGTIILKPLEYNLNAQSERWRQGDKIHGTLTIKNHSSETIEFPLLKVSLAVGNYKKVKSNDKRAWELLSFETLSDKAMIAALEEKEFSWSFTLPEDCPISDKNGSVYLLLNDGVIQLELGIDPKIVMLQFLEIFENYLRFKVVQRKFSKGMVEVKLNPPGSREYSHIDSLVLRMKEVSGILDLEYLFNLQAFETVSGNVIVQKKTKVVTQQLTSKEYYQYGNSPNHDFISGSIAAVIKEAAPRMFA
jgi:hypothetical protein